jgi:hypothetical protein
MSVSRSIEKVAGDLYASVDTFLNDVTSDVSERRSSLRVKTQEAVVVLSNGPPRADADARRQRDRRAHRHHRGAGAGHPCVARRPSGTRAGAKVVRVGEGFTALKFDTPVRDLPSLQAA